MTPPDAVPRPDRVVAGRYTLGPLLGSGGMATVYRADDTFLGRTVALKLFHADLATAADERRQAEEMTTLASLNHAALVTLFDAGRDGQDAFLVMEYVEGVDLRARLESGVLDSREAARVGADVASALAHIHERGVVHRDVKPANILLPKQAGSNGAPHAKLADFGIARLIDSTRLTTTGTLIGTAAFLSPEQARGGEVGAPTDIYSLGLVLLEALTGQRTFPGTALESTSARLHKDPEVPDSLGPTWTALLRQATTRDPERRPRADEFAGRLRNLGTDGATLILPFAPEVSRRDTANEPTERLGVEAPTTPMRTAVTPTRPHRGRGRIAIAAAVALGVGLAAIVGTLVLVPATNATDREATTTVQYPAVEGDLGAHLTELQTSVEP